MIFLDVVAVRLEQRRGCPNRLFAVGMQLPGRVVGQQPDAQRARRRADLIAIRPGGRRGHDEVARTGTGGGVEDRRAVAHGTSDDVVDAEAGLVAVGTKGNSSA